MLPKNVQFLEEITWCKTNVTKLTTCTHHSLRILKIQCYIFTIFQNIYIEISQNLIFTRLQSGKIGQQNTQNVLQH